MNIKNIEQSKEIDKLKLVIREHVDIKSKYETKIKRMH
jgi:hypothetical protein